MSREWGHGTLPAEKPFQTDTGDLRHADQQFRRGDTADLVQGVRAGLDPQQSAQLGPASISKVLDPHFPEPRADLRFGSGHESVKRCVDSIYAIA